MKFTSIAATAFCTVLAAAPANAEDGIYLGAGLSFSAMESAPDGGGSLSEGNIPAASISLGYRKDLSTSFIAAEFGVDSSGGGELGQVGTGTKCSEGFAAAPYYCSHNETIRLRGIFGYSLASDFEVFGSIGVGRINGRGAVSPSGDTGSGATGGMTYGLGVQRPMGAGLMRLELIHDDFDNTIHQVNSAYDPTYSATTVSAQYLLNF